MHSLRHTHARANIHKHRWADGSVLNQWADGCALNRWVDGSALTRTAHIHKHRWADGSAFNRRNSSLVKGRAAVQLVPYSEHSNYSELLDFVRFLRYCIIRVFVFHPGNSDILRRSGGGEREEGGERRERGGIHSGAASAPHPM